MTADAIPEAGTPEDASAASAPPRRAPRLMWLNMAAVVVVIAALYAARPLLMPVIIAVLLALLLSPAVALLRRIGLPEYVGALVVVALLVGALATVATRLQEPAQQWLHMSERDLRDLRQKLIRLRQPVEAVTDATQRVAEIATRAGQSRQREVVVERRDTFLDTLSQTQSFMVGALSCLVLLFFLLASGDLFLRKLVRVLPRLRDKRRAVEISREIQTDIGHYFLTITAVNLALGAVTAATMALLGLPNPLLWGVIVAAFNFIPYVGPAASLVVLTIAAIVAFDTWQRIVSVPAAFALLTLIEGNLIQPLVIGGRLAINPVVIFLAVMAFGVLWGIGGIVIAVPVLVVIRICADHIPSMSAIGEFIAKD
ncbi:MAG TPA: AI-2E family transporter [Burkholderiaceae bacterium]|nr:AI-2E family transporter [Burkholderiaceae bacterium]